jgi:hypothetical protein
MWRHVGYPYENLVIEFPACRKTVMNSRYFLLLILFSIFHFTHSPATGAQWQLYADTSDKKFYYDSETIQRTSGNMVKVLVKEVYSDEQIKQKIIRIRTELGFSTKDFENIEYALKAWEIHCGDKVSKFSSYIYYDHKGFVLDSYYLDSDKWSIITTESVGEKLYKALCLQNQ